MRPVGRDSLTLAPAAAYGHDRFFVRLRMHGATDNADTDFQPWGGGVDDQIDAAIQETRRAVFPLHGLDPDDPRD